MEKLEYLLKASEIEEIQKIPCRDNFADTYKEYVKMFLDESHIRRIKSKPKENRLDDKGVLLIGKEDQTFYDGELWMFGNVEYIGKLDYLFTVPLWDWWINPLFKKNRGKAKSLLVVDRFEESREEIKRVLSSEGFGIIDEYDLKRPNPRELFLFYDYLNSLLPMNFARELNRMCEFVRTIHPEKINFVLRGGYFLKEFFDFFKGECKLLNSNRIDSKPTPNEVYIDDCIGSMRTFNLLGFSGNETFNFCCLNSTLPRRIYRAHFPNINFSLPQNLLNVYSCRLFEENPKMIGLDYSERGLCFYNNPIRDKLIAKIRAFQKTSDLEDKTYKLARELINYDKD